jgi:leucyl/phenylalanyl-tRNA--protein transferase
MKRIIFPPVETADKDGLLAVGGDLEIDTLTTAYREGIFPWPISADYPLAWFSPDPRGILNLENIHLSKSFLKFLKKTNFEVTFNQAFEEVIINCSSASRKNQSSTWITTDIIDSYINLFKHHKAYSVEVWSDGNLVAGLYGVCMGDFISGESMFTKEDNASKYALYFLTEQLKKAGINWMDTQMVTPIVESFGGIYISRSVFLQMLAKKNWTKNKNEIF